MTTWKCFLSYFTYWSLTFIFLDAPEFSDKPKIVQRDGGNVIVIKVRGKSHIEAKAEWFKVSQPYFLIKRKNEAYFTKHFYTFWVLKVTKLAKKSFLYFSFDFHVTMYFVLFLFLSLPDFWIHMHYKGQKT